LTDQRALFNLGKDLFDWRRDQLKTNDLKWKVQYPQQSIKKSEKHFKEISELYAWRSEDEWLIHDSVEWSSDQVTLMSINDLTTLEDLCSYSASRNEWDRISKSEDLKAIQSLSSSKVQSDNNELKDDEEKSESGE
jgi:hypothetical protein